MTRSTITKYRLNLVQFELKQDRKLNALTLKLYDLPLDTLQYKVYKVEPVSKTKLIPSNVFLQNMEKYRDVDLKLIRMSIQQYEKLLIKLAKQNNQTITKDMMLELMHNNISDLKTHYLIVAEEIELLVIF